ncbi:MAG TPA: efflux RND transporter periplasmic adaptor subunit [Opitutaceae bacterium]|nr:efflux RND transporter periplasmic adaptor subunit [Opitutaceae bacterium]
MAKSRSFSGLFLLLLVLAAAGGGGWYYFNKEGDKTPEYTTVKVARGNITQAVTATGDLQPVVTVDIGAQVSGQIKEVLVDFNSIVKAGDVLARIDEATPTQRLKQAEADLASTLANNRLVVMNATRTRDLFEKKLVSQQELDNVEATLAQSEATLLTRRAAVEDAKLTLSRTVITAPIDGMVLTRATDKGRTVNASTNSPVLFTLVNDLSKMQINAAVAEADIGMITEGQLVRFTVDAFPGNTFTGTVRQVRNAATANQSVVSYATIIDVANENLKLKPGMTASVSIIVFDRPDVLRVPNTALRVRIPQEVQASVIPLPAAPAKADAKAEAVATTAPASGAAAPAGNLTDDERRQAMMSIYREIGFQRGQGAPTPEVIEKAKLLAKAKGMDPDLVAASLSAPAGGRRGGRGGAGGASAGAAGDRGFNNTVIERQIYRVPDPAAKEKKIETVRARLGISDGIYTELLSGMAEGDHVLTAVTMPGAAPVLQQPGGANSGMQNPFQQRGGFGGGGGGGGGGAGGGGNRGGGGR